MDHCWLSYLSSTAFIMHSAESSSTAASWLPSILRRGQHTSPVTLTPADAANPAAAGVSSVATAAPSPSTRERVGRRWNQIKETVIELAQPHASVADFNVEQPWPLPAPPPAPLTAATGSGNGGGAHAPTSAVTAGSAAPSPSSASTLMVSITTLNLYSDLSEASGLVLCPGFIRANANSSGNSGSGSSSGSGDPVPSRQHPESISPTILPPLPSAEERRQAQENANAQNAADSDEAEQATAPATAVAGTVSTAATADVEPPKGEVPIAANSAAPAADGSADQRPSSISLAEAEPTVSSNAVSSSAPTSITSKLKETLSAVIPALLAPTAATTTTAPTATTAAPPTAAEASTPAIQSSVAAAPAPATAISASEPSQVAAPTPIAQLPSPAPSASSGTAVAAHSPSVAPQAVAAALAPLVAPAAAVPSASMPQPLPQPPLQLQPQSRRRSIPSTSSRLLSLLTRRGGSGARTRMALDSIRAPAVAPVSEEPQPQSGDADTELDVRAMPPPTPPLKIAAAKQRGAKKSSPVDSSAQQRAHSLMHQLWFGTGPQHTEANSTVAAAAAKSVAAAPPAANPAADAQTAPSSAAAPIAATSASVTASPAIAAAPAGTVASNAALPASADATPAVSNALTSNAAAVGLAAAPAPSSSSSHSLGGLLRSSTHRVSSLASSALFWTFGPFLPHQDTPPEVAASAPPAQPQQPPSPPPPPPPPPPVWSTLRKVVIIGVHGWSLMGGMFGEKPVVVSSKFCASAQRALAVFCKDKGMDLTKIQVCTIPLHGHGKVETRVASYLLHQLPPYKAYLETADAVFVVGHSQGVLVSVSLLHQLIVQGWVCPERQHVSMQLMAGLHHGPFPDLYWDYYNATKELFQYCYVDSEVHRRYMQALHYLLEHGVKVMCIGSVHDQAVPLYSALLQSFPSCPNLMRALYVDYHTYQPDFLHALLSLIIYLMNTGVHGRRSTGPDDDAAANVYVEALVHLSGWLRGGLLEKNGGAHSAVHRLTDCYNLAMEWSLSGRGVRVPVHVHSHSFAVWAPYFQDSFTVTRMNRYMMLLRFRELFSLLPATPLDATQELTRLYHLYTSWHPRHKQQKLLREAFAPLFDVQSPSGVVPSSAAAAGGASSHEDGRGGGGSNSSGNAGRSGGDVLNPSGGGSPPVPLPPLHESLVDLLTPPRLPILPVVLPHSWQMTAENERATVEPLSSSEPQGGAASGGSGPSAAPLTYKRGRRDRIQSAVAAHERDTSNPAAAADASDDLGSERDAAERGADEREFSRRAQALASQQALAGVQAKL